MRSDNSADRPIPNSYWVSPGRFVAGEYPGSGDDGEAAAKLRTLLGAGINHFINLTEDDERAAFGRLKPYVGIAEEEARKLGVTVGHERHPIPDYGVPNSPERMTAILDAIDAAMNGGKTVYVHCLGGVGRTGTVVGCWLARHGRTGEAALAQIAEWWQGVEKVRLYPESPQTVEQREYVRNWTEPSWEHRPL